MQSKTDAAINGDSTSTRATGPLVLSHEIVAFIESGVSIIVGVVGADGRARAGRALAARMTAGGAIRLIYSAEGNAALVAAAQSGGPIAVTFSAPMSHRTIQLKAPTTTAEQLEPEDRIKLIRQTDAFAAVLGALGYQPAFVMSFRDRRSLDVNVLSFIPNAAFEQTPGPGAGREL
jgi:hypothetical protein